MPHTPGPWFSEYLTVYHTTPDGSERVCEVETGYADDVDLITSAPKMLAALKSAVKFLGIDEEARITHAMTLEAITEAEPEGLNIRGVTADDVPTVSEAALTLTSPHQWTLIPITPAMAFDLLTLVARVDDRTLAQQATVERLAAALERQR